MTDSPGGFVPQPGDAMPPPYGPPPYGPPPYGQPNYGAPGYPQGGYPPPGYGYPPGFTGYGPPPAQGTNGLAIASMVLGIIWIWWIGSILALIFGYIARNQLRERPQNGGGMAVAGIVLGWIGVVTLTLVIVLAATGSGHTQFQFHVN